MKIEITFSKEDVRTIIAEHCRKQFRIDPKNLALLSDFAEDEEQCFAKIEGDYRPE